MTSAMINPDFRLTYFFNYLSKDLLKWNEVLQNIWSPQKIIFEPIFILLSFALSKHNYQTWSSKRSKILYLVIGGLQNAWICIN